MDHERRIIMNNAIANNFNNLTGQTLKLLSNNQLTIREKEADGLAEIGKGAGKVAFKVIQKNEIRAHHLPGVIATMHPNPNDWLLLCQYIPDPVKKQLREEGINYVEAAGNAFIRHPNLYIFIDTQTVSPYRATKEGKLWKPTGLKYIFALLQNPKVLSETYRQQIQMAGIAIGNIGLLQEQLKEEGYLKQEEKNGKPILLLENRDNLRDRWVELFNTLLRPKLVQGRYRFVTKLSWRDVRLHGAYWGGEPAGAILTDFLEPEEYTVYTNRKNEVIKDLRLAPDPKGNVELLEPFWQESVYSPQGDPPTVPPLLAYAELIISLDSRNRETAERIRSKFHV